MDTSRFLQCRVTLYASLMYSFQTEKKNNMQTIFAQLKTNNYESV